MLEPVGAERWQAAGKPPVPAIDVDGALLPLLHVSQLGSALGLPVPVGAEATTLAWDIAALLDAWAQHLHEIPWEVALAATPSRGRSVRNLTVNVFHPIELLPAACDDGEFPWDPDGDTEREARLSSDAALRAYADRVFGGWSSFTLERAEQLPASRLVRSPRGTVPFADVLASQRWHAAYHYRQLVAFLGSRALAPRAVLPVDTLAGIDLPAEIF